MTPKKTDVQDLIIRTIGRVLADAAYLFTDVLDRIDDSAEIRNPIGVSLRFRGTPSGVGTLWVDAGLAQAATANMRGLDQAPASDDPRTLDTVRELLNILLGNLLTQLYGDTAVFELDVPQGLPRSALEEDRHSLNALWLMAEDTPLLFLLESEP